MDIYENTSVLEHNDARKTFRKLGTCSQTFAFLLNREFGYPNKEAEQAADPLAGGVLAKGYQCGMLWGASLAVGAESYRRFKDQSKAIGIAILATQYLMNSYANRENTHNCRDVTHCDWASTWSRTKYFLSGKFLHCFKLAEKWAPEAIEAAGRALSLENTELPDHILSCASEVARMMGASDEEVVMVAGFAGGMGLSGNACGALAATIWIQTLAFNRQHDGKPVFINPNAKRSLKSFESVTDNEILCHKICGKHFNSLNDHTQYLRNGGCFQILDTLAKSYEKNHINSVQM